jgi:hypothetical protein
MRHEMNFLDGAAAGKRWKFRMKKENASHGCGMRFAFGGKANRA